MATISITNAVTTPNVLVKTISISYSLAVANIVKGGGVWTTDANGNNLFVPLNQILQITSP
jgi:hypothetical protein